MAAMIAGRHQDLRRPMPSLGRMMVFVDGENLVGRYQAMLDDGRAAGNGVEHRKDVYAWIPATVKAGYIVSGDGDFIPLIKECIRFGKHVHVAALSSGLSPELRYEADQFLLLDNMYTQIGDQGAVAAEQAQDN